MRERRGREERRISRVRETRREKWKSFPPWHSQSCCGGERVLLSLSFSFLPSLWEKNSPSLFLGRNILPLSSSSSQSYRVLWCDFGLTIVRHDMTCFVHSILFLSFSIFLPFLTDLISCQSTSSQSSSSSSSTNSLKLFQLHVCHDQEVTLECPNNSVINIILATYGAAAVGSSEEKMCSESSGLFSTLFLLLSFFSLFLPSLRRKKIILLKFTS